MVFGSARRLRFCSRAAGAVFGLIITLLLGFGGTPAAAQVTSAVSACSSAINQALASPNGTIVTCNTGSGPTNISCSTDGTTRCTFTGACTGSITVPNPGEFTNNTTKCVPFATTASALLFQSLARIAQQTSQISLQAVQTEITSIRDSVQRQLRLHRGRLALPEKSRRIGSTVLSKPSMLLSIRSMTRLRRSPTPTQRVQL